jgi:quercetin dioxygenase-like cupin family protein
MLLAGIECAPHCHVHSEIVLIDKGTVHLTVNGASYPLGPRGMGLVHSNQEHGIKNVGWGGAERLISAFAISFSRQRV